MKPFKKWQNEILDTSKCWTDYKNMVSEKEAIEICKWEGWHWIIRVQLEMFFGLKDKHMIDEYLNNKEV